MSVKLFAWRRKDPSTGRWRVLGWKMTDEDARRWAAMEGAELEKVAGSEELRSEMSGYGAVFFPAQSSEAIERYFTALGARADDE